MISSRYADYHEMSLKILLNYTSKHQKTNKGQVDRITSAFALQTCVKSSTPAGAIRHDIYM